MDLLKFSEGIKQKISEQILADFPDYDDPNLDGIELPEGFIYCGYKNDTCPSFVNERRKLKLYVDYKGIWNRENPDLERFAIYEYDSEEDQYVPAASAEGWDSVKYMLEHWDE